MAVVLIAGCAPDRFDAQAGLRAAEYSGVSCTQNKNAITCNAYYRGKSGTLKGASQAKGSTYLRSRTLPDMRFYIANSSGSSKNVCGVLLGHRHAKCQWVGG